MTTIKYEDIVNAIVFHDRLEKGRYNFLTTTQELTNVRDLRDYTWLDAFDWEDITKTGMTDEFGEKLMKLFHKAPFEAVGYILVLPDGTVTHMEYTPMGTSIN